MRLNKVILQPIVTEKSTKLGESDKYVFKVNMSSTKSSIKEQIEAMFGVTVKNVNTMIIPGKKRRILKTKKFTKTPKWKKAVVQVEEGQEIDLFPKE